MLAALFEEATMPNLSIDPGDSYQSVPSAKSGRLKLQRTRGNNSATSLGRAAAQSVIFETAPSLSPSCRPVNFSQLRKTLGAPSGVASAAAPRMKANLRRTRKANEAQRQDVMLELYVQRQREVGRAPPRALRVSPGAGQGRTGRRHRRCGRGTF